MADFWGDRVYADTGPPLTAAMVEAAERTLGYKLPESYVRLVLMRNGGRPRCCCYPTTVRTSWAKDCEGPIHRQSQADRRVAQHRPALRGLGGFFSTINPVLFPRAASGTRGHQGC